jgi:hypothetical protein
MEALKREEVRLAYTQKLESGFADSKEPDNIDEAAQRIERIIKEAMKVTLPVEITARKPWITGGTLMLADEKRQLKQHRQKSDQQMAEYRKKCNVVRKAARHDKER